MLLRHTFYYLIARGLPGVLNFAALALYTRLLTTEEFGRYALVLAAIGLVDVMMFQWLRLVLARFIPAHRDSPQIVQQGVLALFLALAIGVSCVGLLLSFVWSDALLRQLIALAVPLTLAQAWFLLGTTLASSLLQPARYGQLLGAKSLLALLLGAYLAWLGLGAKAPLAGLLAGSVLAWLFFGVGGWRGVRPRWPDARTLREFSAYGVPLVATFALGWVLASSDRLLIGWLLDEAAAGIYAAGYDFAQQSLGLVLAVVNTAAVPLVFTRLEQEGRKAATDQLGHNGELIVTLAMACAAGLIALAPAIVGVFIGKAFRAGALEVMPWVAVAAAVGGIKAFHLDIAFHLSRQSRWLVITSALAAIINLILNVLLIPRFGIVGAVWATVIAFSLAACTSAAFGRRVFPMPPFLPMLVRGSVVSGLTYLGARVAVEMTSGFLAPLIFGCAVGGAMALAGAIALDIAGIRRSLCVRLRNVLNV